MTGSQGPTGRRDGLLVQEMEGELLIYDLERHRAHHLNGAAAEVWRHCDGTRSLRDLGAIVSPDAPVGVGVGVAALAVRQLRRRKLLEEPAGPDGVQSVDRRALLRKLAAAGAIGLGLPVVKSIVAPTAAQASTCKPSGAICTSSAECCSGVCAETPSGSGFFLCA